MSVGLESKPDPVANVYASLGAGDSIHAGEISEGLLARAVHSAGKRVGVVEDGTTPFAPLRDMIPTPDDHVVRGDAAGSGPEWIREAVDRLASDDLIVVHVGEPSEVAQTLRQVWLELRNAKAPARLFFAGATPPPGWDRLTPVSVFDFGVSPLRKGPAEQGMLTSTTTRTPGLIAARDIAPSILVTLGVPIPIQMTGSVIQIRETSTADRARVLERLDRMTNFDQRAQSPFFWGLGLLAGLIVFIALGLFVTGRPVGSPFVLYLLRVISSWPLALLLAWLFDPGSMTVYLGIIVLLCFAIGLLPNPPAIFLTTAVAIVVDAFFGSRLVSQTILSAYMMSGIRFYGIGNEYMGVLIGGSLMAPVVFDRFFDDARARTDGSDPRDSDYGEDREGVDSRRMNSLSRTIVDLPRLTDAASGGNARAVSRDPSRFMAAHVLLGLFMALVVFVLSFPAFGAKAGGAVTATATFLFLAWELRGERVTAARAAFAILAGFALVFAWVALSRWLHLTPTHIDTAVGALQAGRFGYIIGVASRKIGLAVRVALHPGTIVGGIALIVLAVAIRSMLRDRLKTLWIEKPVYRAVVAAGLRGAVVALLFNDSGIVAVILLSISLLLPVLYEVFKAGSPASGSESRIEAARNRL